MGLLRRSTASLGSFAGIPFTYRLAIRRADTTVVVAIDPDARGSELMARLRAAGVAQLLLDRTLCRARVAGWDTALGAVIFDLPHLVEQAAPAA
jgi:hypothetical protein